MKSLGLACRSFRTALEQALKGESEEIEAGPDEPAVNDESEQHFQPEDFDTTDDEKSKSSKAPQKSRPRSPRVRFQGEEDAWQGRPELKQRGNTRQGRSVYFAPLWN